MITRHSGPLGARRDAHDEAWKQNVLKPGLRILVVEDRAELRGVIMASFSDRAVKVYEAGGVEEAVAVAAAHEPDLVLLDFNLPDGNGYELIRRLRSNHAHHLIPAVMLSGSPRAQSMGDSLHMEFSSFLRKPSPPDSIVEACGRALGGVLPPGRADLPEPPAPEPVSTDDDGSVGRATLQGILDEGARASALTVETEKAPQEMVDEAAAEAAPVVKLVSTILSMAVDRRASDVHIEPQEKTVRVRFRMDGVMVPQFDVPKSMSLAIAARLKVLSHMNIAERRVPQDGRFRMTRPDGRHIELRVSTIPGRYGEKVVMRLLGRASVKGDVAALGLPKRDLEALNAAIASPNGLILVTGPTGSGKTTTLYTLLAALNSADRNILTVEDPVEYEIPGITQVGVRPELGLTFEKTLRAFLRQDPDVILVGEIRDRETAEIAMKAASTGHLVLSTLHTNDAASTLARLLDMGVPAYMAAATIRLVVAQRLVRMLCPFCKRTTGLTPDEARLLSPSEAKRMANAYSPAGCSRCDGIGYRGRSVVAEVMPIRSPALRSLITKEAQGASIEDAAVREGMRPLRQSALSAVESGLTSMAEAVKVFLAD
jgi:type IV pilus assembly protein PilB